jgi:hypothetical protein
MTLALTIEPPKCGERDRASNGTHVVAPPGPKQLAVKDQPRHLRQIGTQSFLPGGVRGDLALACCTSIVALLLTLYAFILTFLLATTLRVIQ